MIDTMHCVCRAHLVTRSSAYGSPSSYHAISYRLFDGLSGEEVPVRPSEDATLAQLKHLVTPDLRGSLGAAVWKIVSLVSICVFMSQAL